MQFSSVLTELVLHTIIKPIDIKLNKKTKERINQGYRRDHNHGGITNLLAYVDDLNCVIPYDDAHYFLHKMQKTNYKHKP